MTTNSLNESKNNSTTPTNPSVNFLLTYKVGGAL